MDEADNITKKAQNTLCNLMEIYDKTTKFVLTCNDYNKLVEGIQTRCLIIRYNSISKKDSFSFIGKLTVLVCIFLDFGQSKYISSYPQLLFV